MLSYPQLVILANLFKVDFKCFLALNQPVFLNISRMVFYLKMEMKKYIRIINLPRRRKLMKRKKEGICDAYFVRISSKRPACS